MATKTNTATQIQTETQAATQPRERQSLDAYVQDLISHETGEVLARGIILDYASFLPAREDGRKATLGGLMDGYIDLVTGQPCMFEGRNGEMIAGGAKVRFFGEDAEVMDELLGERPVGLTLGLELQPETTASVYRGEDGSVLFLVLNTKDVVNAGWVKAPKVHIPGRLG